MPGWAELEKTLELNSDEFFDKLKMADDTGDADHKVKKRLGLCPHCDAQMRKGTVICTKCGKRKDIPA